MCNTLHVSKKVQQDYNSVMLYSGNTLFKHVNIDIQVIHGTTLTFDIGYFSYSNGLPPTAIIVSLVSAVVILFALTLAIVLCKTSDIVRKEVDKCLDDIDRVQLELGEDMRRGELRFKVRLI